MFGVKAILFTLKCQQFILVTMLKLLGYLRIDTQIKNPNVLLISNIEVNRQPLLLLKYSEWENIPKNHRIYSCKTFSSRALKFDKSLQAFPFCYFSGKQKLLNFNITFNHFLRYLQSRSSMEWRYLINRKTCTIPFNQSQLISFKSNEVTCYIK